MYLVKSLIPEEVLQAAEHIRSRSDIPVIFLTAYSDDEKLERAKLVMPYGYLFKPFENRALLITIEMALYTANVEAERTRAEEALKKN